MHNEMTLRFNAFIGTIDDNIVKANTLELTYSADTMTRQMFLKNERRKMSIA